MRMTPPFLFVKDDGAGLPFEAELSFDPVDGLFEDLNRDAGGLRRIQAHRKQGLLTPSAA